MYFFTKKRFIELLLGFILFSTLLTNCGNKSSTPIARVGGSIITVQEFESSFSRGKTDEVIASVSMQEKKEHLEKMIDKELQIIAAYRKELDKDKEILEKLDQQKENILLRQLYNKEIVDKLISDSEIKGFYNKSKNEIKILDIFLKLPPNPTIKEQQAFDDTVKIIKKKINAGVAFDELVKKYSQERNRMGLLKWSPASSSNPVYQKAFSMRVNEISDLIKVDRGYTIIKVTDVIPQNLKSFDDEKNRIKQDLIRIRSKEMQKNAMQYLEDLKKKYHAKINEDVIDQFIKIYTQANDSISNHNPLDQGSFDNFTEDDKKLSLAIYDGGEITIGKLISDLQKYPAQKRPELNNKKSVHGVVDQMFLSHDLLNMQLKVKNVENDKEAKEQLREALERLMLSKIRNDEINDKIKVTDDIRLKYYNDHKEDFKKPAEREVQEIYISDEKLANQIASRARQGENFVKLVRKYNEKKSTKLKDGNLGFIRENYHAIGPVAFQTEIGSVGGPVKLGKNFAVIKVLDERQASYKLFDECKGVVENRVVQQLTEEREKEWMKELREDVSISIFDKKLEKTFSILKTGDNG